MNQELPGVKTGFQRSQGQIANIHWIMEKSRDFQTKVYFCFIDYAEVFDCVGHNTL